MHNTNLTIYISTCISTVNKLVMFLNQLLAKHLIIHYICFTRLKFCDFGIGVRDFIVAFRSSE